MFKPKFGRRRIEGLSQSELRSFKLRAQGYSAAEVAKMICRSASTVKCHDDSVKRKLKARSIAHAVHIAHQHGYLH